MNTIVNAQAIASIKTTYSSFANSRALINKPHYSYPKADGVNSNNSGGIGWVRVVL